MLKSVFQSPLVGVVVGATLALSALMEVVRDVTPDGMNTHHGVLIFGIFHTLKSFAEMTEAGKGIEEWKV